jgi:hypothetical protein
VGEGRSVPNWRMIHSRIRIKGLGKSCLHACCLVVKSYLAILSCVVKKDEDIGRTNLYKSNWIPDFTVQSMTPMKTMQNFGNVEHFLSIYSNLVIFDEYWRAIMYKFMAWGGQRKQWFASLE